MLGRFGENLPEREVKFAPCDLKRVEADGTFAGYASLFGEVDLGQDLVMPGAFRDSLRVRGTQGVKLLFQHDPNEPIGVSVFCPGAVNTNIFEISRNLDASFEDAQLPAGVERDEARARTLLERAMDPLEAARIVLEGIRNNYLYILSHANLATVLHERHEAIEAAIPGAVPAAGGGAGTSMYARERDKMRARKARAR